MTNAELIKSARTIADSIHVHSSFQDWEAAEKDTLEKCAAALEELQQIADHYEQTAKDYWKEACDYKQRLAKLETQLPKEGEWIDANTRPRSAQFYCSVCHRTCYDIQPTRDKAWTKRCRYNYCPNCGARMKTVTDCHTFGEGERKEKKNEKDSDTI